MKINAILKKLSGKSGQNLQVSWERTLKTRKGVDGLVEKKTVSKVRTGIEYDNQLIVQMRREIGELPPKNQGLPWGTWAKFPYHVRHNDTDYVRIYPSSDRFAMRPSKPKVEYFLDGEKITEKKAKKLCRASEFSDKSRDCFMVKAENVKNIK